METRIRREQRSLAASVGSSERSSHAAQKVGAVIREYEGFVRAVVRLHAHNAYEEEELYQKLFLSLLCDPRFPDVKNMKSYLYHIVVRDAIDAARWKANERKRQKKFAEISGNSVYSPAPDFALIRAEEVDGVLACADRKLKRREATAVALMYRDDCPVPEIARRMGVNERTVHRYITAALRTLRRMLKR
jgi:RNA polymerase sigma factor (sigma-70 family)